MKDKAQTIGQGFVILSISNILVKVLSLVFVPLIRGLLGGDSGYSVYSSAYSVYAFVYVIATAGFPVAISKLISEYSKTLHTKEALRAFKIALRLLAGIGFVLMALVMIFAKPIARFMQNEDSWAGILFLAPTVFFCSLLSGYRGYFQGRKNMRPTAFSQIMEQLVHVAVSAILVIALKKFGVIWAVAGATAGTAVGALVAFVIVYKNYKTDIKDFKSIIDSEIIIRKENKIRKISDRDILKKIFYYSLPLFFSSAVQYGGDLIDSKMIKGGLITAGFTEQGAKVLHGQYMAMRQLINVPGSLATALCVSVLPIITSCFAEKNMKMVSSETQYAFKLCYMVAVPIAFAFAVFAGAIYTVLGYGNNIILLVLSSLSVLLLCTVHLQSSVLQGANYMFTASIFLSISVILKAVLNSVLIKIPSVNIYGAIISTYISYIIPVVLNLIVMKKKAKIRFSILKALAPAMFSATFSMIASFVVYWLLKLVVGLVIKGYICNLIAFLPAILVAVYVYLYVMRKTDALTDSDLEQISPKLKKIIQKIGL